MKKKKVCVIIPSYKVKNRIIKVIKNIDLNKVSRILVIDDACPQGSGRIVIKKFKSKKISVIFLKKNIGVGGATIVGFKESLKKNYDITVKIDGDGQHNPKIIPKFIKPIIKNRTDFCKGTRFYNFKNKYKILKYRLMGNIILSFITRLTSGYWNISDVVNGYFAIDNNLLKKIKLNKLTKDYFFEQDLIFQISLVNARVKEIPIKTVYHSNESEVGEISNLNPNKIIPKFIIYHIRNILIKFNHPKLL